MTALALLPNPSTVPGHMECKLRRELPDGVIEYSEAEKGWLTKDGTPRRKPERRYVWTPNDGEPVRLTSVSTLRDAICPRPGLPYWAEAQGIAGAAAAMRAGWITPTSLAEHAIAVVREQGLGAEAAKQRAADRGLNIHAINAHWMQTGEPPKLSDHPEEHRGYLRSWAKATLALEPEPREVETLVAHPEAGFAGRLDQRAVVRGALETDEYKTAERGSIYPSAILQALLYEHGAIRCGADAADRLRVIALPADGQWVEDKHTLVFEYDEQKVRAALGWWREKQPIESACGSQNRAVRGASGA